MTIGLPHQLRTIIFRSVGDVEVGIKGFAYLLQSKPYCPLCNRSVARNMNDFDGFTAVTACKTTHHFTFYAICVPPRLRPLQRELPAILLENAPEYLHGSVCFRQVLLPNDSPNLFQFWIWDLLIAMLQNQKVTRRMGQYADGRNRRQFPLPEKTHFYKKERKTSIDEEVLK